MKNVLAVILLFFGVFAFLGGVYFVSVKLYFNDAKTLKRTNYFVRSKLQRQMAGKARVSPLGAYVLKGFRLANRGGFDNGEFLSLENFKIKLSLWNMLKGIRRVKSLEFSGLAAKFDYTNNNLEYAQFFQNFSGNVLQNAKRYNFVYEKIVFRNAKIDVVFPGGTLKFTNVNFESFDVNLKESIAGKITGNINGAYFEAEISYNFAENTFALTPVKGLPFKAPFVSSEFLIKNDIIAGA